MKALSFLVAPLVTGLLFSFPLLGQAPAAASMGSTTKPSATLEDLDKIERKKEEKAKERKESLPKLVAPPALKKERAEYLHPGILVNLGGKWEGSDHLLNLSRHVGVYVTLIKPESAQLKVSEEELKKNISEIFSDAGLTTEILVAPGKPPLPLFQIEIFVYPIDRGYAAFVSGRLFESVSLERFKMDSNMAFQAITWEKQHLMIAPQELFAEQVSKVVQEIAETFSERFQIYDKMKKSL